MSEVKIPDFDEMMQVAEEIRDLMVVEDTLKLKIEEAETKVYQETSSNPKYLVGGKTPSNAHVKSNFIFSGLDGEIKPLRESLVTVSAQLEFSKMKLDIMRMQIDLYRTESANRRTAVA